METEFSNPLTKLKTLPVPIKLANYSKVRMTHESVYSVTKPDTALAMAQDIVMLAERLNIPANCICDATANIGGNTLAFSLYFQRVLALEIKEKTHGILRDNLSVYRATNVYTKCSNVFSELASIAMCDMVFVDPPWYLGQKHGSINRHLQMTTIPLPDKLISLTYSVEHLLMLLWNIRRVPVFVKVPSGYQPIIEPHTRIHYKKMDILAFI